MTARGRGRTGELARVRSKVAGVRSLFAYGLNSLRRLEELTPMVVRERLSPTFESAVEKYEEAEEAARQALPPLEAATAITLILDGRSRGKLSVEEATRLLERAEQGDRSLLPCLEEVLANRNRASEATKEERELIKEGTEMKTKEEEVIKDYRDLFDDLLLRSDKEEGDNVNHVTEVEAAGRYKLASELFDDLLGTPLLEGEETGEGEGLTDQDRGLLSDWIDAMGDSKGKRTRTVKVPRIVESSVHGTGAVGYEEVTVEEHEPTTPEELEDADLEERHAMMVDLIGEVLG